MTLYSSGIKLLASKPSAVAIVLATAARTRSASAVILKYRSVAHVNTGLTRSSICVKNDLAAKAPAHDFQEQRAEGNKARTEQRATGGTERCGLMRTRVGGDQNLGEAERLNLKGGVGLAV